MPQPYKTSIIIPTLDRPESLERCLGSLREQIVKPYEIIIKWEKGPLAKIRNEAAKEAKGDILIFIDDDVWCTPGWLRSLLQGFRGEVVGVSGPSVIRQDHRKNRDLFRWKAIKKIYDCLFLEPYTHLPGKITPAGTFTTRACEEDCFYRGPVDYLEACNMAVTRDAFWEAGGFDESYGGIGDWSEPDLSFRIRERGHKLWFEPEARLYHEPSKTGAFFKRKADSRQRMDNYLRFSRRWIAPCWRHSIFKAFLRCYFGLKTIE